ncbi:MAG: bifunctional diaminohydroxyphosphoribosylaminopyrimidine deaminase/5-amino-6-(5-phosphoribosylamino)uracil reductase RibD [Candidatus Eremiobacteraeota bacterium]|nr:bifunctional diaminohydroxyphosphoribosylaminopyrimidine deaminase/5-amino-6-(5-phosphoribosylamino)uracil reductase RibD [Candidatus Eremiobacteraeota bacterium]
MATSPFAKACKSVKADPSELHHLYLERACELASRAAGGTSPNPPVGAVLVRNGRIIGEGFHRGAGTPHAEIEAMRAADNPQGATLYSSLEPCTHTGRTPPCTRAIIAAGIARVIVGALDPNPQTSGAGVTVLRDAGVCVEVFPSLRSREIIEPFSVAIRSDRPYVALKMATSLDGYVAPEPGSFWLTGEQAASFVRDLRIMHNAVMIGAGTVRVDDPQLTVRPAHHRGANYRRIVLCQHRSPSPHSRVFHPVPGYETTIVVAPRAAIPQFSDLRDVAEIVPVGESSSEHLDLTAALQELKSRGVGSILCEGGPTLAGRLIEAGLLDRVYWLVAPRFLGNGRAVAALGSNNDVTYCARSLAFDRVEQLGNDVLLSGRLAHV